MDRMLVVSVALVLSGCTTHALSMPGLRRQLRDSAAKAKFEVADAEIRRVMQLEAQLPKPFKLAIWFAPSDYGSPHWRETRKQSLLSMAEQLRAAGVVSETVTIPDVIVPDDSPKGVRLAAARLGAHAVLVVRAGSASEHYHNPAAVLYVTVIGGFLAPGTHHDELAMVQAALWDVGNERLYAVAESEAEARTVGPSFLLRTESVQDRAADEALAALSAKLLAKLKALPTTSP